VPRFSQLFKQTTGTNVRRFKIWCRQYLIVENLSKGLSFAEAAHAAGYADYGHFSRRFLEMSGINPSVMFNRVQKLHLDVFRKP
jgi:AraC-like DNA-binding protein